MADKTNKVPGKGRMVLGFLKGSKRWFVLSILLAAVVSVTELINPKLIGFTIDSVIGDKEVKLPAFVLPLLEKVGGVEALRERLWLIAAAIAGIALLAVLFRFSFRVCTSKGAETLSTTMRDSLFEHISRLPFSWHTGNQTGDIIQRCTADVDSVKNFLSEQLTSVIRILLQIVLSLCFMLSINKTLSIVPIVMMPIIILYSVLFRSRFADRFRDCDENEGKLSAIIQENLTGVRVVRAFGREKAETDKFDRQNDYYTSLWTRLIRLMSVFWALGDLLSGLQVLLIVILGSVLCVKGQLTPGDYIAFISYNTMLVFPVRHLGRMISEMSKAGISIDRIAYIMQSPEEEDKPGALTPPLDRDIVFDHVSFGYEGTPELLHDVSFTVPHGTTLGILGGTGSGKSTLMHLLTRLYDLPEGCGSITVGGVPIGDMKAGWVRSQIGIVLQEPFLFSRSIKDNIGITEENPTDADLEAAVRVACLEETLEGFEKGWDTEVGERGVTLSGGQKQRAAIARTLMKKTPVMIFDDSLSAVDAETDQKIRRALKEREKDATVILISHRLTTLMQADRIIVLGDGRIVEQGTHDELIALGGLYKKIYDIQQGMGEEEDA